MKTQDRIITLNAMIKGMRDARLNLQLDPVIVEVLEGIVICLDELNCSLHTTANDLSQHLNE